MSPHLRFLHMTRKFSTDNVRGVRDKYQVWLIVNVNFVSHAHCIKLLSNLRIVLTCKVKVLTLVSAFEMIAPSAPMSPTQHFKTEKWKKAKKSVNILKNSIGFNYLMSSNSLWVIFALYRCFAVLSNKSFMVQGRTQSHVYSTF